MFKLSNKNTPIILASSSPRRLELMQQAGIPFQKMVSDFDETPALNESPKELTERLALGKAKKIAELYPEACVVGADTIVVVDGIIFGKPIDLADSARMLSSISGRWHNVITASAIVNLSAGISDLVAQISEVKIRKLSESEIQAYVSSGEGLDKAGAYAIQGIGSCLVSEIKGSYTNVVGLDIANLVARLIGLNFLESVVSV